MENEKKTMSLISQNWHIISAAFVVTFAIGGLYTKDEMQNKDIQHLKEIYQQHLKDAQIEHQTIQAKQDAKWGDIPEIEQRVDDLEEYREYLKGVEEGKKK